MASVIFGGVPVTGAIARMVDQHSRGREGADFRKCCTRSTCSIFMAAATPLAFDPAGGARRRARDRCLEHGRKRGIRRSDLLVAGRCAHPALDLSCSRSSKDLMLGIAVGATLGAFLFLHRMAELVEIKGGSGS